MGVFLIKKFCKQDVSVFKKKMQRNILSKKKKLQKDGWEITLLVKGF